MDIESWINSRSSAVHSFIFDVEDDLWDNLAAFTDEDTEEIQKMKSNAFIEKPDKNLNYVFHLLKGKVSLFHHLNYILLKK